jgi:CRP-like cAMP-binding protein
MSYRKTTTGKNTQKPPPLYYMQLIHTYKPGGYFGELALEDSRPRAARIVAATDCHFAVMSRDDYKACLETIKKLYVQ